MSARDAIHDPVRKALENDEWTILADPYSITYADRTLSANSRAGRVFLTQHDKDNRMDKVTLYRQKVKQVLNEFIEYISGSPSPTDRFTVFDDEKNSYVAFDYGWYNKHRIHCMPTLMRIINGKVWVEANNTDYIFVDRLLEAGIPHEDIVLAFHPPEMRQYTDFAVA